MKFELPVCIVSDLEDVPGLARYSLGAAILGGRGGIVCHLANGSEGCVHRAGRYITVTRPTIFVVVRVAQWLACLALFVRRLVS